MYTLVWTFLPLRIAGATSGPFTVELEKSSTRSEFRKEDKNNKNKKNKKSAGGSAAVHKAANVQSFIPSHRPARTHEAKAEA